MKNPRKPIPILWFLILLYTSSFAGGGELRSVKVSFYSSTLQLPALNGSELDLPLKMDPPTVLDAYEHFQNCTYQPFLSSLVDYREKYGLSDWHLYEIVARASETMYIDQRFQIIFQWFMLHKAGLDVQLFYFGEDVYLHAPTSEVRFGFYTIEYNNQPFINLTARRNNLDLKKGKAYMPNIQIGGGSHRKFGLELNKLPDLPDARVVTRALSFNHRGQTYQVMVDLNEDHLQMMDEYPYYNQRQYFHMELSKEAEASLLPQLKELTHGKNKIETIEFLLSFVRTAFFYKDDRNRFGKEKPMSPEQTLYYSYSDCEDRSALFFYLVREMLELPAIVLDFESHVGVAVELEEVKGDFYEHKGRRFVYCEATGPDDKLKIGEMWPPIREQKARILTEYLPQ